MSPSNETKGARKRSVRRDAALREYQRDLERTRPESVRGPSPDGVFLARRTSRFRAITLGLASLVLGGGVVAAGMIFAPEPMTLNTSASPAQLPAAPIQAVCPPAPRLPDTSDSATGEDGSAGDVQFSPVSSDATTTLTIAALSDLAGNVPGITQHTAVSGTATEVSDDDIAELTPSQPEEIQQGAPASSGVDGVPVEEASIHTGTGQTAGNGQPVILNVEPLGGSAPLVGAVTEFTASDGDLHGLSAASCTPASHQQWIVGPSTQVGTTSVLTLTNPTATPAQVTLNLYGAEGHLEAAGTTNIGVAPNQTRSFVLAGLAPREDSVGINVTSDGGQIAASVQQYTLSGIDPLGGDTFQASPNPSNTQVIPALGIADPDNAEAIVHVVSPGTETSVTLELRGEDGVINTQTETVGSAGTGGTAAITVEGIEETGVYSVAVRADAPITATGVVRHPGADIGESAPTESVAAIPAAQALGFDQATALSADGDNILAVTSSGEDATVTLTPFNASGEAQDTVTLDVSADSTVTYEPSDSVVAVRLATSDSTVYAGVSVRGQNGTSAYPVNTASQTATGVPVRMGW